MNVLRVTKDNFDAFEPLITTRIQTRYRFMEDVFVLGAVEDDTAVGVIEVHLCPDGGADIDYIFITPAYRRKKIATELIYSAAVICERHEEIIGLRFSYTENLLEENGLLPFFTFCGFDITENTEQVTYYCDIENIQSVQLPRKTSENITLYRNMGSYERKLLLREPFDMISTAVQLNLIEPDLSCCIINGDEISDCFICIKQDDEIVLAWTRSSGNGIQFISLLNHSLETARKKYSTPTKIVIPALNKIANDLCRKILGDILKPIEKSYTGTLMLDDEAIAEEEEQDGEL